MKKIKKRGAIYGVIALLLCVAVYLNWSYVVTPEEMLAAEQTNPDSTETSGTKEDKDYFAASRPSRARAREEGGSTLKGVAVSETAGPTAQDRAAAQISALAEDSVAEANIESMIRAKGYEDAVVMIGDESVNVVVAPPEGGLQATDVTVIKDIVVAEAGVTAGQIKIVEAE